LKAGIAISMADTCIENPYAERINGIIKNDYLIGYSINSLKKLERALAKAVTLYNNCPHGEMGMMTPLAYEALLKTHANEQHAPMLLYDFTMSKEQNLRMGFLRHNTMKIVKKEKPVALGDKATGDHFHGSAYSLEGCSPAEPSSALADPTKVKEVNQDNKLTYQQINSEFTEFCQPIL
jgi:hypothetical protein